MTTSYKKFWQNILNFSGTSDRPDYWWPIVINYILAGLIMAALQIAMGHSIDDIYNWRDWSANTVFNMVSLITAIATWSVTVRRLHDTNRTGWWILIQLLPLIGSIWLFILLILPSKPSRWRKDSLR